MLERCMESNTSQQQRQTSVDFNTWNNEGQGMPDILRADTLEANPMCVNPVDFNPPAPMPDQQQQVQTGQPLEILYQTESGSNYLLTDAPQALVHEPVVNAWANLTETNVEYALRGNAPPASSATSANPAMTSWTGAHGFNFSFEKLTENAKNKSWDYSPKLNKLFIDMGKDVMACFTVGSQPQEGLFIRMLPIYAVAANLKDPVVRCPNHAAPDDPSNKDINLEFRHHLIRLSHDGAIYDEDAVSKRLSVRVPVERPQGGTTHVAIPMKFMCLGSDIGGINRRPLKVIFTLEDPNGQVVGRQNVDVRICSCPKRDKSQEEKRQFSKEKDARKVADSLGRRASSFVMLQPSHSSSKKRKIENVEDMVMVPVAKVDFEKVNELVEGSMIARNISKAADIKAQRRRLLDLHNPNVFKKKKEK